MKYSIIKNIKVVLIVLGFFQIEFAFSQNDTILRLFRTTYVQNKQKIELQANIETLKSISAKIDNNNYTLKKGSYIVADSIGIEVSNTKQIIAITFFYEYAPDYSNDTAYIHELKKYQKIMNAKGREYQYISKYKSIRVTKWQDNKTIFELIELSINGKKRAYSVIFDTELYYKKFKSCIDLNKNENSIELIKLLGLI